MATNSLDGEGAGVNQALSIAARELEHAISGDTSVDEIVERLRQIQRELADLVHEIAALSDDLDIDPAALDQLMLRQRQIKTLLLRHGPAMSDLLDWLANARLALDLADPSGSALAEIEQEVAAARSASEGLAELLHSMRELAAAKLSSDVAEELRALAMPFALFEVSLERTELAEHGADRVEFQFSANPGLPLQAIQQSVRRGGCRCSWSRRHFRRRALGQAVPF